MDGNAAVAARNPEKLPADDLRILAAVTYEVRALNDGVTHEPFGDPAGPGLWHHKGQQLPAYIQQVAQALVRDGTSESRAIATAVSRCKVWCAGGQHVTAETKAKACAAVAEWEKLKVQDTKAAVPFDPSKHARVPKGQPGGGRFAPGSTSGTPTNEQAVGQGEATGRVTDLQRRLNQLGFHLKVDGKFGPETLKAVKQFQASHTDSSGKPLKVDGLVGPKTTSALRMKTPKHIPVKHSTTTRRKTPAKVTKTPAKTVPVSRKPAVKAAALATIPNVDLLAAGSWDLSSGRNTFTRDDITDAIEAAKCPAVGDPVIKLGHIDPRFDGQPAIGRVRNMRPDASGMKLLGDLTDMPGWLAEIAHAAFPKRSIEGTYGFKCQVGHMHPFVLTGLALLGVTAPGVGVLNDLQDIASLYGVSAASAEAAHQPWALLLDEGGPLVAVTEEDVRRAYYATSTDPTWWISEMQMHPAQLVVSSGDGGLFRVPFQISDDGELTFGDAEPVADYAELAAARGRGRLITYASAADSRAGVEPEDEDEDEEDVDWDGLESDVEAVGPHGYIHGWIKVGPGSSAGIRETANKLPPSPTTAAVKRNLMETAERIDQGLGAGVGARLKNAAQDLEESGLSGHAKAVRSHARAIRAHLKANPSSAAGDDEPDDDVEAADYTGPYADPKNKKYKLSTEAQARAAWSYINMPKNAAKYPMNGVSLDEVKNAIKAACKKFGIEVSADAAQPPELSGDNETGSYDNAGMSHGPFTGTHSHPHPAMGSQGSDESHSHSHTHKGDASHDHAHANASAGNEEGDSEVDFTSEHMTSLRASLGLAEDDELDAETLVAAMAALKTKADAKVSAAARKLPAGVITVEEEVWKGLNQKVEAAEQFRQRTLRSERDEIIDGAIRAGKVPASRKGHWQRVYDGDPESTREILAGLKKNTIPVEDIGGGGGNFDDETFESEFAGLYPPGEYKGGR